MRRKRVAACALLSLLIGMRVASAQPAAFPSRDVRLTIAVHDGTADVSEEYVVSGSVGDRAFELFAPPCASIGPIAAAVGGRRVALTTDARAHEPWTEIRFNPSSNDRGGAVNDVLRIDYEVRTLGSDANVPIALPAAVLERADGLRGARVRLTVTFDDPPAGARVLLPRVERAADRSWQGSLLAVPSFVRMSQPHVKTVCDRSLEGTTGGLEWRTVVFAGTMATWVPIYLWWFGRRRSAAERS